MFSNGVTQLDIHFIGAALQPYLSAPRIYIGYSGGIDSHVLLHLCAQCPPLREKLCALHVHHGIQSAADAWLKHCETIASALNVAFLSRRVDARPVPGHSPEETARNARYHAFADIVGSSEVILSAQHRDDQMETVFLQLFRGAGLAGLAAMPRQAVCGKGLLLRPLLEVPKETIQAYAEAHRLHWVEDPSNTQYDYDRNYLRHVVVPLLKQRWTGIDKTVARTARHCANAQSFLEEIARPLFEVAFDRSDRTLNVPYLQRLDRYRQQLLLRLWFKSLGQKMPAETIMERISSEIIVGNAGRNPELPMRGGAVCRYRNKLYWFAADTRIDKLAHIAWPVTQEMLPLPGNGHLRRVSATAAGIDPAIWNRAKIAVRYRQGGERIRLPGRYGRHELKKLFQEHGVPPWEREKMPLLFFGEQLAAVGNIWIEADFFRPGGDFNYRIAWSR
ncbi:MAG: tRNA lysidine(34) synthetase TilS [Gammaproteobacteria bacterium]